jgi:hypothetical protein
LTADCVFKVFIVPSKKLFTIAMDLRGHALDIAVKDFLF